MELVYVDHYQNHKRFYECFPSYSEDVLAQILSLSFPFMLTGATFMKIVEKRFRTKIHKILLPSDTFQCGYEELKPWDRLNSKKGLTNMAYKITCRVICEPSPQVRVITITQSKNISLMFRREWNCFFQIHSNPAER